MIPSMIKLYTLFGMVFAALFLYGYFITGVPNLVLFGLTLFFPVMAKLEERK